MTDDDGTATVPAARTAAPDNAPDNAPDDVAAIRSGLESGLVVHDERVVFQGGDESQFTVIQADVSVEGRPAGAGGDGVPATAEDGDAATHPILFAQVRGGQPSVVCVAVRDDGRLLLARHWRIATDSFEWEFPRSMGVAGEVASRTAERELETEAGLASSGRRLLQLVHTDTCKIRGSVAVVEVRVDAGQLAEVERAQSRLGEGGDSKLAWMTTGEIDDMIAAGNIMDGITLAAYTVWKAQRADD
ncbi:NUDIX domain-containing protein [Bifidobacterium sp. 82T24]|uniref:NUDIX hydrolase n=1 Tax=Bifidobacterium pluvialisilvae TaxID=2834436 RepID=UPI001C56F656|nr:NUDIX domain-containing protein [Bifidobacterium pluvialisilvae]MBW3088992.1 NUDIX domain-containing protein [Bifidobacterium pluvialisilvae]